MNGPWSAASRRRASAGAAALALVALLGTLTGSARAESPKQVSAPSITGIAQEGQVLTAQPGSYNGAEPPFSFEYEWRRCNPEGADCTALLARGATYTVVSGDVGYRLRTWVLVTGQDCGEWNYSNMTRECRPATVGVFSESTPTILPNPGLRPQSTAPPTISGTPEEGETLVAADGGWSGLQPITTARQWERCDATGSACRAVAGATADRYLLTARDVGARIRLVVNATNARGASPLVTSAPTVPVRALLPRPGRTTIDASRVERPHRLVIDRATFAPSPLEERGPVTARVLVSDTRGFRVRGALVRIVGAPPAAIVGAPEATTGADGWARLRIRPGVRVNVRGGGFLTLVVHARPGEDGATGVAAQRRFRVPLGASGRG